MTAGRFGAAVTINEGLLQASTLERRAARWSVKVYTLAQPPVEVFVIPISCRSRQSHVLRSLRKRSKPSLSAAGF
jgi:hypothetical protein